MPADAPIFDAPLNGWLLHPLLAPLAATLFPSPAVGQSLMLSSPAAARTHRQLSAAKRRDRRWRRRRTRDGEGTRSQSGARSRRSSEYHGTTYDELGTGIDIGVICYFILT